MFQFLKPIMLCLFLSGTPVSIFGQADSLSGSIPVPKEVSISLLLLDIVKIDDVNKKMTIDFAIRMSWNDESFKGKKQTILIEENKNIWRPELQFLNSINLDPKIKEALEVSETGQISYVQRYVGDLSLSANFSDFPFDKHEFKIKCVGVNIDSFTFVPSNSDNYKIPNLTQAEWEVSELKLEAVPFNTQVRLLPGFEFKMQFKRKVQFYIWKTVIPLTLVIFMSWMVFWVHPKHLEAQVAITVTSMLTMVTFQFILSNILPPLSYLTKMDIFIFGANLMVFLTLVETILSAYYYDRDNIEMANKVDKWSRYFFPLFLIITYVSALLW